MIYCKFGCVHTFHSYLQNSYISCKNPHHKDITQNWFLQAILLVIIYVRAILKLWSRTSSISITWQLIRDANFWALPWTYWIRIILGWGPGICVLISSPETKGKACFVTGREKFWSKTKARKRYMGILRHSVWQELLFSWDRSLSPYHWWV